MKVVNWYREVVSRVHESGVSVSIQVLSGGNRVPLLVQVIIGTFELRLQIGGLT